MGDDHDCGEPADIVPDPAIWVCAVLPAWGGTQRSDNGPHLSRHHPVRVDPSRVLGPAVVRAKHCDDRAEPVGVGALL